MKNNTGFVWNFEGKEKHIFSFFIFQKISKSENFKKKQQKNIKCYIKHKIK
jgi:hypothetical protein